MYNKKGTSNAGAISKAQKAQKTFLEKNLNFLIFFPKMSHGAYKCKKGYPSGFINIYSVAKYQKTRKEHSFEKLKKFQKTSQVPKKI